MTRLPKIPTRSIRVLAIGAAVTIMIAACTSNPTEQGGDPPGAQSESLEDRLAYDAAAYREDVAVIATATATEPEQWLLDATVTREEHQFGISGLKISWELPGDAQVTDFDGGCTRVADRQTCLTSSNLFGRTAEQINLELLVNLPTSSTDRTIVVSVTYAFDRYDYNTANNTTTLELE